MSRKEASRALEERIGYRFASVHLLDQAVTHISALKAGAERLAHYQRLEFLGDRVLGLVVSEMLFQHFPNAPEGELSRRLSDLVRGETCAEIAVEMGIGPALKLGAGEAQSGGRKKAAILADVCEAVIGAVFLDGGFDPARQVIAKFWSERMSSPRRPLRDAKTALQEWAQGKGLAIPAYDMTSRSGPDHKPQFRVTVHVEGYAPAEGAGASKRAAEQQAAEAMLRREDAWTEDHDAG